MGKAGGGEEQNKNSCFELNSVLKKEKKEKNSAGEIQVKIAAVLNFKSRRISFSLGKCNKQGIASVFGHRVKLQTVAERTAMFTNMQRECGSMFCDCVFIY